MDFMLHYYTQNDDNHRRMMPNNLVGSREEIASIKAEESGRWWRPTEDLA